MSKNYALATFAVFLLILWLLVWFSTGSIIPPTGNEAIWFHAGLLTLLIGTFIFEYRFTKPNDVFINCLIVFVSVSTLSEPPYESWWNLLKWSALACGVSAVAIAWDPGVEAKVRSNRFRDTAYQIITRIGSARVVFSIVFLLALLSFFDLNNKSTKLFAIVWAIFLLASYLDLASLLKSGLATRYADGRAVVGMAHSFLAPSIVFCRTVDANQHTNLHDFVGFCQSANDQCHAFGVVVGFRESASEKRIAVALIKNSTESSDINDRSLLVSLSDTDREQLDQLVDDAELESIEKLVGTVSKNTNISQLRFELIGSPTIAAGSLLSVEANAAQDIFYQVFEGVIDEEDTLRDSSRSFIEGRAEQIGCWDDQRGGFETHDWVAKEREPVQLIDEQEPAPNYQLKQNEISIGRIPKSFYPVHIELHDLVLFHSAILGVTGSGKSFLTFNLVEECAARGIKVVCIDPSGDYQKYLNGAVMLSQPGACLTFLNSPDHFVGIIETAAIQNLHPIVVALRASSTCLDWCKANRQDDEILDPKPKVLVVLEEAHLLVPEFNFNPDRDRQNNVSQTAQCVLQARKYGLGFMIVSQRTANVVKSVLNQCNTIFSFQAFDDTGFDFLRNYMGSFHVQSLPNLKSRHGIIVGKASRSRRPVMVHFHEQDRDIRDAPAPDMPMPVAQAENNQEAVPNGD